MMLQLYKAEKSMSMSINVDDEDLHGEDKDIPGGLRTESSLVTDGIAVPIQMAGQSRDLHPAQRLFTDVDKDRIFMHALQPRHKALWGAGAQGFQNLDTALPKTDLDSSRGNHFLPMPVSYLKSPKARAELSSARDAPNKRLEVELEETRKKLEQAEKRQV
jgi:hypothetical protein